jgi:hypothetical protein
MVKQHREQGVTKSHWLPGWESEPRLGCRGRLVTWDHLETNLLWSFLVLLALELYLCLFSTHVSKKTQRN